MCKTDNPSKVNKAEKLRSAVSKCNHAELHEIVEEMQKGQKLQVGSKVFKVKHVTYVNPAVQRIEVTSTSAGQDPASAYSYGLRVQINDEGSEIMLFIHAVNQVFIFSQLRKLRHRFGAAVESRQPSQVTPPCISHSFRNPHPAALPPKSKTQVS